MKVESYEDFVTERLMAMRGEGKLSCASSTGVAPSRVPHILSHVHNVLHSLDEGGYGDVQVVRGFKEELWL